MTGLYNNGIVSWGDNFVSTDLLRSLNSAVDRNSPIPYYVQVKGALREHIESGNWQPGDQLPGEPELCQMFGVSRTVIRQALKEMEYEGLIVREKGKGTFLAEPKIVESLAQKLTGFYQDMVEQGYTPITRVLKQEVVSASPKVAAHLGLEPETPVIEIERLRFVQDEPIVLVTTYLPYALCPQILSEDLSRQSLYALLEKCHDLVIARGRRTLEAVPANEYEAQLLQVDKGSPLLMLDSVSHLGDGTPVEYYHALHRGDRSRFAVELIRIREQGDVREILGVGPLELPPSNELAR